MVGIESTSRLGVASSADAPDRGPLRRTIDCANRSVTPTHQARDRAFPRQRLPVSSGGRSGRARCGPPVVTSARPCCTAPADGRRVHSSLSCGPGAVGSCGEMRSAACTSRCWRPWPSWSDSARTPRTRPPPRKLGRRTRGWSLIHQDATPDWACRAQRPTHQAARSQRSNASPQPLSGGRRDRAMSAAHLPDVAGIESPRLPCPVQGRHHPTLAHVSREIPLVDFT